MLDSAIPDPLARTSRGANGTKGQRARPEGDIVVGACAAANLINLPVFLAPIRHQIAGSLTVVLTRSAARMLPASTVGLLVDHVVDESDPSSAFRHSHMRIALDAALLVVLPATAHVLAAAANGLADGVLTTAILASPQPVLFFPSMNRHMWASRSVQRNVRTLRDDGHLVVDPKTVRGYEVATGTMTDNPGLPAPPEVVDHLTRLLSSRAANTAGHAPPADVAGVGQLGVAQ